MLRFAWKKAKTISLRRQLNQTGECFVTIYSKKQPVVNQIVDFYLSNDGSFHKLHVARAMGDHEVFVSDSLVQATERLIQLRRSGRVSSADGSACHLVASVNAPYMEQLVRKSCDFRPYLRELSVNNAQFGPDKQVVNL